MILIESYWRSKFQIGLETRAATRLALLPVTANQITLLAAISGFLIVPMLYFQHGFLAMLLLLLSGLLDMFDGVLARAKQSSAPLGTVLDIMSDRFVEASIVVGLYAYAPEGRAILCLAILASIFLCVTSFLVVGIFIENTSNKGFHYHSGLIERAEAFVFFGAMIMFPNGFSYIAWVFVGLVVLTALIRLVDFARLTRKQGF